MNNPVKYTDPTGHWVETAVDVAFIAYDLYDISQNGLNWENGLALAADVAGAALPFATGGGLAVRAAFKADDAARAARTTENLVDAARAAENLQDGARAASEAGQQLSRADAAKQAARERAAGGIDDINPNPSPNDLNCSNCVVAADIHLHSGVTWEALPRTVRRSPNDLAEFFGSVWQHVDSYDNIIDDLLEAGNGSRGIVMVEVNGGTHVFNVVNNRGTINFFDAQQHIGGQALLDRHPTVVGFMRTDSSRLYTDLNYSGWEQLGDYVVK